MLAQKGIEEAWRRRPCEEGQARRRTIPRTSPWWGRRHRARAQVLRRRRGRGPGGVIRDAVHHRRTAPRSWRAAVRQGYRLHHPLYGHRHGEDGGLDDPYIHHRQEDLQHPGAAAHPGAGRPVRQEAADHRRGRGGRGPVHPDRQPSARHPERGVRQGPRLRRPPQGDAAGYRHPDRRHRHLRGSRSGAEGGHHGYAGPCPPGEGHQGEHHHRGRRRRQRGHQGPRGPDPRSDRDTTSDYDRRSCRSGWPSWPAAWPSSRWALPPRWR